MKLLVLGASGGCGKWIIKLAIKREYQVRAIIRPETLFDAPEEVEIFRGYVQNEDVLESALHGCDVVVSALGIKRKNTMNPWSDLASPDDLTARVTRMLVKYMPQENIDRFIGISAAGVRESIHSVHPIIRWLILNSNMKASYKDLAAMESTFEKTALDWLAVRPVTLKDGGPTGKANETDYYGLLKNITRGDVAEWILNQIEQPVSFSNRTPLICSI